MEKQISGRVRRIGDELLIAGENVYDDYGSMLYKFKKINIEIIENTGSTKIIQFLGSRLKLLEEVEKDLEYIFFVNVNVAYGKNYYDCRRITLVRNCREKHRVIFETKIYDVRKSLSDNNIIFIFNSDSQDNDFEVIANYQTLTNQYLFSPNFNFEVVKALKDGKIIHNVSRIFSNDNYLTSFNALI